jgi:hypothetical protein
MFEICISVPLNMLPKIRRMSKRRSGRTPMADAGKASQAVRLGIAVLKVYVLGALRLTQSHKTDYALGMVRKWSRLLLLPGLPISIWTSLS